MNSHFVPPSNSRQFDPTTLPPRWLECPRKSTLIANKFIAFKTPLDKRFDEKISKGCQWNCSMLIDSLKREKKNLGLIIDLTNTERFYRSDVEFTEKKIQYEKIRCRGHGETPNDSQINRFIQICQKFNETNPDDVIGVHCTHGFNRSGFLICAFLYQEFDMSIDTSIHLFGEARPPGIYKQDYLDELMKKFGNDNPMTIAAPERPPWCLTNSDDEDEPNERPVGNLQNKRGRDQTDDSTAKRPRTTITNSNPQFAVPLTGVTPVRLESRLSEVQLKCQRMCEWNRQGFPGSQPVSMDSTNYMMIFTSPYMVSWKADGTRYMMLIEDQDKIYMFDRDHNAFQISHLHFPQDSNFTSHWRDTLVDGELVIDVVNGVKYPRYLIYDIVTLNGENVMKRAFRERLHLIRHSIVDVRNAAIGKGFVDRLVAPFSIRAKDFYDLPMVPKLVGERFRSGIAHEVDGLIFQPESDPYTPGRSLHVLKWKEDNTIDFRLQICLDPPRTGELREKRAFLYVNGLNEPFAQMPYHPDLRQYNNKIIECSYHNHRWHFCRQRTDKSFPNAKGTAFGAIEALERPITKATLCDLVDKHVNRSSQT